MAPRQSGPASGSTRSSGAPAVDGTQSKKKRPPPAPVRPSSSILLISPTNQVLLLHRVQTSTSFASAHVFPGGNLSGFHEGELPSPDSSSLHQDSEAYRLAAVRETFEESGILLAKALQGGSLLSLSDEERETGRKAIHSNSVKFTDWLARVGGKPDIDALVPFTRWITPPNAPNGRRFSTQMYLYMLPLSSSTPGGPTAESGEKEIIIPTPTHDGGLEHTAATFDDPSNWISRARSGEIILFPPQFFLLHLVSQFCAGKGQKTMNEIQQERDALLGFMSRTPTVRPDRGGGAAKLHATASIPWAEKVMSPTVLFMRRSDRRVVLGLDKPGPELKDTKRGGDWDRVVLVHFLKDGPRDVEVRWREDVMREERELERREEEEGEGSAKL